jgi:hypothetical protein
MASRSDNSWHLTLTNNRVLKFLLTNKYVQPTVHVLMVGLFLLALWEGLTGPQDPSSNFAAVAFFELWWIPVMLFSLVLIGRLWCYFCPLGAIVRFTQRFGLKRHFPMFSNTKTRVLGISVSVVSITAITFILARMPMYNLGMVFDPQLMAYFFLIFTVLAIGVSLVYQRQAFCRYVCPATGVMTVTSRLSPFELRQEAETGVQCATLEYKSEYLSADRRCVSCMKCTTEQPEEDVGLRARWPGAAAVRQRIPLPDEAILIIVLWAVFPIDHVLSDHIVAVTNPEAFVPAYWVDVYAYFASLSLAFAAYLAATAIGSWWSGIDWEESFTWLAYAYLPWAVLFMLGNHAIPGFLESGGAALNVFFSTLGIPITFSESLVSASTISAWNAFNATLLPWIAVLWGLAIVWFAFRRFNFPKRTILQSLLPHAILLYVTTAWVVIEVLQHH